MGKTSAKELVVGEVYSRRFLSRRFHIRDASLRNGIFRPKGYDSVWLFVTEIKTPDRTQYHDKLRNGILIMDGQTLGRTDYLITSGLELLLFYRLHREQYPEFGFRYEGRFRHVSHKGSHPTRFRLRRVSSERNSSRAMLAVKVKRGASAHGILTTRSRVIKRVGDLSRKRMRARFKEPSDAETKDLLNERSQAHQKIVAKLYSRYAVAGLECREWPFDLLVLGPRESILHEIKTVRQRDYHDQRKRIREAVGQLAYYEYFDVARQILPGAKLYKVVVLQHRPLQRHIMFLRKNGVGALWIGHHGRIEGERHSIELIKKITGKRGKA